jgi:alpha-L-rhamnosidase
MKGKREMAMGSVGKRVVRWGAVVALVGIAACRLPDAGNGAAWTEEAASHLLTPKSDRVPPVRVVRTEGAVEKAEGLLAEDGESCRLTYDAGGKQPVAILDLGKGSVGGYAVFTVTAKSGLPVVRLSYACHPDGLSETGCFTRETSARYLGSDFDLPVLPGNIYRHETYTVPRTGRFIAPLIQGQARYVRVQLDTPGTSVDIDAVALVNSEVYDRTPNDGFFLCGDERLNKLWAISTWTLQIASFPNHDAWKSVDGWLLPRKLEQSDDVGLSRKGTGWGDVTVETTFELRANPGHVSAAGVAFRAADARNAYLAEAGLDGTARLLVRKEGRDRVLCERKRDKPLVDGTRYRLAVEVRGSMLTVRLDGAVVAEANDATFAQGRVGFYTPKEKWPLFDAIRVTDTKGRTLLEDDFSGDLSQWEFARTLSFVADGAKRDRLVWSGDLYFAQRSAYYAWAEPTYLRDSLKMLAFNQTPDGYVHASPYPERSAPPPAGDYGPFPSDEFAAWLVPVAWDHLLYTGDKETMREIWPSIARLLGYLRAHTGADGLFVQRPETSKHAGNLNPGDTRRRAYMNVLLWGTFRDAARIARALGKTGEAAKAQAHADAVRRALYAGLWDETDGFFKEAVETPRFGSEANALALAMGLVTPEQARRIAPHFQKIGHGKFQSLASRGRFEYGFAQSGLQTLFDHNWLKLLDESWKGAWTTTECMGMLTRGWGDESHPDTAVAAHFSAYLLGVAPTEPGYKRFKVRPQPTREVRWAKGIVPAPRGSIRCEWELKDGTFELTLTVPRGTRADVELPARSAAATGGGTRTHDPAATGGGTTAMPARQGDVTVNGKARPLSGLTSGTYRIVASGVTPEAWADPTEKRALSANALKYTARASSSHEAGGWGIANLAASEQDTARRGYSSAAHTSVEATEWIELDLGEEATLARLALVPRADEPTAGFPRAFTVELAKEPGRYTAVKSYTDCPPPGPQGLTVDLYTVIGYPSARYIRLTATWLGEPARDEPGQHRLQLSRLRLVRPEELRAH